MKFTSLALAVVSALLFASLGLVPQAAAQDDVGQPAEQHMLIRFSDRFEVLAPFLNESGIITSVSSIRPVVAEITSAERVMVDGASLRYRVLIDDTAAYAAGRAEAQLSPGLARRFTARGDRSRPRAAAALDRNQAGLDRFLSSPVAVADTPPDNVAPIAAATSSVTSGESPLTVLFDGSGSSDADGSIVSYEWDFGDFANGSGVTTSHVYTSAATFTATLTVTDDAGATATDSVVITVTEPPPNANPVADVAASVVTGISPLVVDFDATGSSDSDGSIVSYAWDFGDGTNATGVSASHTFTSVGTFTATVTVTDDDDATATDDIAITVSAPSSGPIIETGVVSSVDATWQTVSLTNTYVSPVVVATVNMPDSLAGSVVARVRNAGAMSFEVRVQTPDGAPAPLVDVHFVVIDEGVYTSADHGVAMEVVRVEASVTADSDNWTLEPRVYENSYTNPVVIGQVMTANDADWSVFWASAGDSRTDPPNAAGFSAGKHVGEDPNNTRADETIGYIVIEAGSGFIAGVSYEAGVGSDTIEGITETTSGFLYSLNGGSQLISAIASSAAMDGSDGGWPVLYGPTSFGPGEIRMAIDEDTISDAERQHTTEQVAYLVFGVIF